MKRTTVLTTFLLVAASALVVVAAAAGRGGPGNDNKGKKNGRAAAAVTVFDLRLEPKQEVPRIQGLRAHADGNLTLDVTRDSSGAITSGKAVFYFNYDFPGSVTIAGLHVHQGAKKTNGSIVIDSGLASFTDADGDGNATAIVTSVIADGVAGDPRQAARLLRQPAHEREPERRDARSARGVEEAQARRLSSSSRRGS